MRPRKASGSNWGRLGGLGRLWVSLRASWEGLGGLLGRSWSLLGGSGGLWGRSWGLLEWSLGGMLAQGYFLYFVGSILDRFGGPNGPPEEPKMELKIDQN